MSQWQRFLIVGSFILAQFLSLSSVSAVNLGDNLLLDPSDQGSGVSNSPISTPGGMISMFLRNAIILAGVILMFLIIFGGFTMITAAGNPEKQQQGQQTIVIALIGFAVIVSAYWIVEILEIILGTTEADFSILNNVVQTEP